MKIEVIEEMAVRKSVSGPTFVKAKTKATKAKVSGLSASSRKPTISQTKSKLKSAKKAATKTKNAAKRGGTVKSVKKTRK